MKAIVTGGAGFIGSHVAERLALMGHDVLIIDDLSGGRTENIPRGVSFERRDVCTPLDTLFCKFRPALVYHLAAYAAEGLSHHIPQFNYQNNLVGTANVLNASYRSGAAHFVFTSSIAVYGHPPEDRPFTEQTACQPCDPYGVAKLACEHHIAAFREYHGGPDFTIFRPHNVFGPRQNISDPYRNVVGIFLRCALQRQPMPIFGDGTQTRSFSYIRSVARCIADAPFVKAARNTTFNVGGDLPLSVAELAERVAQVMQVPRQIQWQPERKEVRHAHCDHTAVRTVFREAFEKEILIDEGLRLTADWLDGRPIPPETACPAGIEIFDHLPSSWVDRVASPVPAIDPPELPTNQLAAT